MFGGKMLVALVAFEPDDTISSHLFRDVQRVIRGANEGVAVGRDPRMWPCGYAKAGGAANRRSVERECMRLDLFAHPFRERHARVEDGARQQQHELLLSLIHISEPTRQA